MLIKGIRPGQVELFRTVGVLDSLRHTRHLFDDMDAALEHARSHIQRAS